jgi:hypothetical protein
VILRPRPFASLFSTFRTIPVEQEKNLPWIIIQRRFYWHFYGVSFSLFLLAGMLASCLTGHLACSAPSSTFSATVAYTFPASLSNAKNFYGQPRHKIYCINIGQISAQ